MSTHVQYVPGPAAGARIEKKDGPHWSLILVRDLAHPPERVWAALTEPEHLREWAPYDSDRSLGTICTAKLTTVGAPGPHIVESRVKRADKPKFLEFDWGGGDVRWELEPLGAGTRLTLRANIDRNWIAMGAAGWHLCLDVLDHLLAGQPIGRMAGPAAMKVDGFQRLHAEYASMFGVEMPKWAANPAKT
jgi:uncharacterized protein YndB with AHSA1/START domain